MRNDAVDVVRRTAALRLLLWFALAASISASLILRIGHELARRENARQPEAWRRLLRSPEAVSVNDSSGQ